MVNSFTGSENNDPDNVSPQNTTTGLSEIKQPSESTNPSSVKSEKPSRPFSKQSLYNLLLGEFAAQNGNISLAIEKYSAEADATRDPQVASHATRLALYGKNPTAALANAKIWYELESDDEKAASIYAELLAQSGKPLKALDVLEAQLKYEQSPRFYLLQKARYEEKNDELKEVIRRLESLREQHSKDVDLIFTYAVLLQKDNREDDALNTLRKLKGSNSNPIQTALLTSKLLSQLGRSEQATKTIKKALKKHPDDKQLRLQYARLLTLTDLPLAEKEFFTLLKSAPNNTELLFSHALVAIENSHYDAAIGNLQKLIKLGQRTSISHYYLGGIAEKQDNLDLAISHYKSVNTGKFFIPATQQLVTILNKKGNLLDARKHLADLREKYPLQAPNFWMLEAQLLSTNDHVTESLAVLSAAIEQFPEQLMLRIERSFISEKLDNFELVESDLLFVLARDPDNVTALNALGYTLTNHSSRFHEALDLIEQAIALKPGDAAITDSLGWAHYRLGHLELAIAHLETAFAKFPDDEVAAHLIEVYWANGEKAKAQQVVKTIQKNGGENPKVKKIASRLGISH